MSAWLKDAIARALAPVNVVVDRYPRTVPDVVWTPWFTARFLTDKELAYELHRPLTDGRGRPLAGEELKKALTTFYNPKFYVGEALRQLEDKLALSFFAKAARPVDTLKLPGLFAKVEKTYGVPEGEIHFRVGPKTVGRIVGLDVRPADNVGCDAGAKDREERHQAKNEMYRRWYGGTARYAPPLTIDVENGSLEWHHDPRLPPGGIGYQAQRWTIKGTVRGDVNLWEHWKMRTTVRVRFPYDANRNRRWTGPGYIRDIRVVEEPFGTRSYEVVIEGAGSLVVR